MGEQLKIGNGVVLGETLAQLELEDLLKLQKEMTVALRKKRKKPRGLPVHGYVQKDQLPFVPLVMDWLIQKKYIKKPTYYNMTSFALRTLIENVLTTIKEEAAKKVAPPKTPEHA